MRSLSSGMNSAIGASGAYPGWLIQIVTVAATAYYYTTLDTNFTWNSITWLTADIESPTLVWDGSVQRPARLVFGDADLTIWTLAVAGAYVDAAVTLYQVYASAGNESEPVWAGYAGQVGRVGAISGQPTVSIDLTDGSDMNSSPRTRIQEIVDEQYLLAAGTVLQFTTDGQITLLAAPRSAAG